MSAFQGRIPFARPRVTLRFEHAVLGSAALLAMIGSYELVHKGSPAVLGLALVPVVLWLVTRSYGGLAVGLAVILVVPSWEALGTAQATVLRLASAAALVTVLIKGRFRLRLVDGALLLVVAITVLSWLVQYDQPHAGRVVSLELTPVAFYFGARALPRSRISAILQVILVAGTAGALTVIYEYMAGHTIFVTPFTYQWSQTDSSIFRPGGVFGSPPGASTVLAFVLLLGFGVIPELRGRRRITACACLAICSVALVLTFTRAALIAVAVGLVLFLWLTRSPLLRPMRIAWLVVLLATVYLALVPTLENSTTFQEGIVRPGTLSERESYWGVALPLATRDVSHFLFGVGAGSLEAPSLGNNLSVPAEFAESPQVIDNSLHNQYLTTLVEQGLIGVAAFALFFLGVLVPPLRRSRPLYPPLAGLTASLVAMAIIMTVDTALLDGPSFAMFLVTSGLIVNLNSRGRDGSRHALTMRPSTFRTNDAQLAPRS